MTFDDKPLDKKTELEIALAEEAARAQAIARNVDQDATGAEVEFYGEPEYLNDDSLIGRPAKGPFAVRGSPACRDAVGCPAWGFQKHHTKTCPQRPRRYESRVVSDGNTFSIRPMPVEE